MSHHPEKYSNTRTTNKLKKSKIADGLLNKSATNANSISEVDEKNLQKKRYFKVIHVFEWKIYIYFRDTNMYFQKTHSPFVKNILLNNDQKNKTNKVYTNVFEIVVSFTDCFL